MPGAIHKSRKDRRTRRDRTDRRWALFQEVLPVMVDEYMGWKASRGNEGWDDIHSDNELGGTKDGTYEVTVVDVFCEPIFSIFFSLVIIN